MESRTTILNKLNEYLPNVTLSLLELAELNMSCKLLLQDFLKHSKSINASSMIKIQAIIDYMYEEINIGNWKQVKPVYRKTITIASYLKLIVHLKTSDQVFDNLIKESFKIIDFGILFGCPLQKEPKLLQDCATYLHSVNPPTVIENNIVVPNLESDGLASSNNYRASLLEVLESPSMEYFYSNYILKEKPVILDKCINHWPALSKWKEQSYFIRLAGLRTVSVEVGSKYTDSDWTQKLMTIEEFIKNHIYQSGGPTGYLAQYQLFDQIPELKKDIIEPDYCCFSDDDNPVDIMAWYGPKGTISPMHHDPKKNLLAQVVGEKLVFIFSPADSQYLYPHEHELLCNTARIDPRDPDLDKYPEYKKAKGYYCILKPGQMLFIPPKWWHFVESLSVSFSVSFWWD